MKEVLAEVGDFKIWGRIINKVRFVDDTAITAKKEALQDMMNRLVETEGSMAWKSTSANNN